MARQNGFSLLEMLIAFTILTLSLVVVLRIFSSGVNTAMTAEEYTVAVQIAESLLAQAGVVNNIQEGIEEGEEQGKYHWSIRSERYLVEHNDADQEQDQEELREEDEDEDEGFEKPKLYQITVTVNWGANASLQGREVELKTLRLVGELDL